MDRKSCNITHCLFRGEVSEACLGLSELSHVLPKCFCQHVDCLVNSLAGAWENLVTGFANKNADLEKLINDVVSTAETALQNLLPAIEQAINGIISGVEKLAPILIDKLPDLANKIIPPLIDAAKSITSTLISVLPEILSALTDMFPDIAEDILKAASETLPQLADLGTDIIISLADGMTDALPELVPVAIDAILKLVDSFIDNAEKIGDAAIEIITVLADALTDEKTVRILTEKGPALIVKLTTALIMATPKLIEASTKIIKTIADNLVHVDWRSTADQMMNNLIAALDKSIKQVAVWIDNATAFLTGQESKYGGDIANVPTSEFISWMEAGKDDVVNAVGDVADAIAEGYDAYYGAIEDGNEKVSEAIDKSSAYYNIPAVMTDYASSLESQAKQWKKTVNNVITETEEDLKEVEARLKAKFEELEIAMLENGYSEEWLVHQERQYLEALDHSTELYRKYNLKLLKEEEKITKAADAARENEIKRKFADFEREALKEGKTEQWLLEQERKYIETLDHASELYKEYDLKLMQNEKKLNDDLQKQRKKDAENTQKAFEKTLTNIVKSAQSKIKEYKAAIEKIKSDIQNFSKNLMGSYEKMFSFDVDEKTGKVTATKTKDYLYNATKQMETYYKNIQKLKDRDIDKGMLSQLTSMDAEKGAAVASYWASLSDKEFKALEENWKRYEEATGKISEELYSEEMAEAEKQLNEERNSLLSQILNAITEGLPGVMSSFAESKETVPAGNLTINVAGQKVLETAMNAMMKNLKNSGGVLDV